MATWIVVGGVLALGLILGGAFVLVLYATRERSRPVRVPGLSRMIDAHPAEPPPDEDPDPQDG